MEEWPDDHLDDLFRKSAEEYEVPFNSDDWTDMSRRLDVYNRQTLFDRISRWGGIGALLLLLLGGVGWVMYGKKTVGNQQAVITTLKPAREIALRHAERKQATRAGSPLRGTDRTDVKPGDIAGNKVADIDDNQLKQQATAVANDPAGQPTTKTTNRQPVSEAAHKPNRAVYTSTGSIRHNMTAIPEKSSLRDLQPSVDQQTGKPVASTSMKRRNPYVAHTPPSSVGAMAENETGRSAPDVPEMPTGTYPKVGLGSNVPENTVGAHPDLTAIAEAGEDHRWLPALTSAASLSTVIQQVRPVAEPTLADVAVDTPIRRAVPPRLTGLSVLLFASPDLSGVGLTNFDRPGNNAGLSIQYQITDRLSVNAGAMYSIKRYQTYSADYVWPPYMAMDVWPEEIAGVCKMIDIPLNVRYDWLLRPRGDGRAPARWFASAGLTSYFIRHEVYSYAYANPDDPKIKYRGWDNQKAGRAGGSFGFSNLNISVGYERPITNRLSWQVEPFLKVPLKQVGYFRVKLLSTGAFVGLRYRL